MPPMP
ncbi:uncharacterized protein FFM5_03740 [Fusarium fujikuroi]